MDLKLLKMRCKDCKQHQVMFHELYSVSSLLRIAQNVRFEIPYKVLYFKTPFLMIFKYYAWASYAYTCILFSLCSSLLAVTTKIYICILIEKIYVYLTIILRGRAGYETIDNQRGA